MDLILNKVQAAMKSHGYQARTVAITHLPEVQEAVGKLVREGLVAKRLSDSWHFYLKTHESLPEARLIIIVAMPQPFTRLTFQWRGNTYSADIPPTYFTREDDSRAERILKSVLEPAGYRTVKAHLALKTLAVRSGLAEYGRNNISYVPGMGSLCQLVAFYSDCPCEEDSWHEPAVMKTCEKCNFCRDNCINGSITADRFLIHAENCPGFLYDINPNKAHWAECQPEWPDALIGCMRCQSACPVNKPYLNNIKVGPSFSEQETSLILNKTPWEQLSLETSQKLEDIRGIYPWLAINLSALAEKQRQAG